MSEIYDSPNLTIVIDNNVLVDLYEIGQLGLPFRIFDTVIIPEVIYQDEVFDDIKTVLADYTFEQGVIAEEAGLELYRTLTESEDYRNLSSYDKEAISIAHEQYVFCGSNDGLVRKACVAYSVQITGILGVLGRGYKQDELTEETLRDLIEKLSSDETTCFIKQSIIDDFLDSIFKE